MRLPVAAKTAFATAGAIAGTQSSPIPVGASRLGTANASIFGAPALRSTQYELKFVCTARP